jgi:hypothetical protein
LGGSVTEIVNINIKIKEILSTGNCYYALRPILKPKAVSHNTKFRVQQMAATDVAQTWHIVIT